MAELTYLCLILLFTLSAAELKCKKKGPCSCELSDGSRTIDLSALDGGKTAFFKDIAGGGGYQFDFNPCTGMENPYTLTGENCKNVCVCQHSKGSLPAYTFDCGDPPPVMNVVDGKVQFVYTGKEQGGTTRKTKVNIVCDSSQEGELSSFVETPATLGVFTTTLKTKHACGNELSSGLSIGSILVIVFVSLLVIYFIAGILIMKFHRGAESVPEMIPNNSFWASLPGLIKDGCLFFGSKIKSCCMFAYGKATGSGYQEV